MRTLFFGTPALAVPYLEALHQHTELQAVITSPDQPAGRGYAVRSPAVKVAAERLGIAVLQPEKVRAPEFLQQMQAYQADVAIVVAYGKLLPADVLATTTYGFLNVHFSLLPAYRGAAPIQWALINGEAETGVSLFWLDPGMDTGAIFLQKRLPILSDEDAESLRQRLIPLGVEALGEGLRELAAGRKTAHPQVGAASHAAILTKEDGRIDWNQSAIIVANRIRGLTPWPGAFCFAAAGNSKVRLKVLKCRPAALEPKGLPGSIVIMDREKGVLIKCGEGALELKEVQPEGKKPMAVWSWLQGARLNAGDRLE